MTDGEIRKRSEFDSYNLQVRLLALSYRFYSEAALDRARCTLRTTVASQHLDLIISRVVFKGDCCLVVTGLSEANPAVVDQMEQACEQGERVTIPLHALPEVALNRAASRLLLSTR